MKNKWIISRHTRDMNLLIEVALLIKKHRNTINEDDKIKILKKLNDIGIYTPRFGNHKKSTLTSKINQLAFYMFGYKIKINKKDKFLFSPLGNLLIKNIDNITNRNKIFLTMLWGLQFPHPHSKTDYSYKLYPFRLLFKLMNEPRLNNKLYVSEIVYFIMRQKSIDKNSYNKLVDNIINFRIKDNNEVAKIFLKDKSKVLVNGVYECDYYLRVIMEYFQLIDSVEGEVITKLHQGKSTIRKLKNTYCVINENIKEFIEKLESNYSFTDKPLEFSGNKHKLDITREIYNFYPDILLLDIGENIDRNILKLPKLINEYAKNKDNKYAYKFENILEESFNLFINVDAKRIGGAGNTDIECLYLVEDDYVFAVEAKSTKNKLNLINSGRLKSHREQIGANYTIIITPRYVPAVLKDIKNTDNVIIEANTFAEYLHNSILKDERNIDYTEIHNIVLENLGVDISDKISDKTFEKFAISNEDIT